MVPWKRTSSLATCACLAFGLARPAEAQKPDLQPRRAEVALADTVPRVRVAVGAPVVRRTGLPLDVHAVQLRELLSASRSYPHVASPEQLDAFASAPGHKLVMHKSWNRLYLFEGDRPVRVYRVARSEHDGDKQLSGDHRTPEGLFRLGAPTPHGEWGVWMTMHAADRAKADYVESYGEAARRAVAAFETRRGPISTDGHVKAFNRSRFVLRGKPMWSGVGIHGGGNRYHWTHGCVALDTSEAHDLAALLRGSSSRSAPVLIMP